MRSLQRSALLGLAAVLATGCAQMGSYVPDSMKNGDLADKFKNPAVCAAAGALLAGGVGAVKLFGWAAAAARGSSAPQPRQNL